MITIDLDIILEFVFEPNSTLKVSSWDESAKPLIRPHHNSLELKHQSHINDIITNVYFFNDNISFLFHFDERQMLRFFRREMFDVHPNVI